MGYVQSMLDIKMFSCVGMISTYSEFSILHISVACTVVNHPSICAPSISSTAVSLQWVEGTQAGLSQGCWPLADIGCDNSLTTVSQVSSSSEALVFGNSVV